MDFEIKENIAPNMDELIALYDNVGWSNYTNNPQMLKEAYNNSLKIISAWDKNRLIGIIRVVGDGHSIIYIQDLLVLKEYQGKGIGSKLLSIIVKEYENVYQKILLTENQTSTVKFYEHCGFSKSDEFGCVAFVNFNN
jgi:ribosomal protein S18 acetylase RimI-like enzyme